MAFWKVYDVQNFKFLWSFLRAGLASKQPKWPKSARYVPYVRRYVLDMLQNVLYKRFGKICHTNLAICSTCHQFSIMKNCRFGGNVIYKISPNLGMLVNARQVPVWCPTYYYLVETLC